MGETLELLRAHKPAIQQIAERYGARSLRVFGSAARGAATSESDIDLLVDFDSGRSLLDQVALRNELTDLLGRPVDVIPQDSLHWILGQALEL